MGSLYSLADLEYMFYAALRNGTIGTIGAKGDPGGITLGTDLAASDLNTIVTSGVYVQATPANATTANNYPAMTVAAGGILMVSQRDAGSAVVHQRFTPTSGSWDSRVEFTRIYVSAAWTPWRAYRSSRVDQTAGRAIYMWDDLNNREQLTYGDTGWRELSATDLVNGWTANSVLLRRFNNIVSLKIYNLASAAATSDIFLAPASMTGFTRTHGAGAVPIVKDPANVTILSLASTGLTFSGRSGTYCTMGYTECSWTTTDAWPTALPGTASGAVPNV